MAKEPDNRFPVKAVQAKLDSLSQTDKRWHTATFALDYDATPSQYLRGRDIAIKRWLRHMEKLGWELAGRVAIFTSEDPRTTAGLFNLSGERGKVTYTARALFKKDKVKSVRVELPESCLNQ